MRRGGQVGGRYRLVKGPVRGGGGEVWLAHDDVLGRRVVLKRVPDRPRAEGRVLARFSHPNVVTLHDTISIGKGAKAASWLVMEYVPGGSLDERPPLPGPLAAHVGAQLARALVALHREGVVHTDVKPGNVVVAQDGTAKLADFGAAYRVGGKETMTPNGAVSYTPDYAAPEVVTGRPEPASDIFSLAATVHALVAGHPPRPGAGRAAPKDPGADDGYLVARRAARGEVEIAADAEGLTGPAGAKLRDALTAMLSRDPAARPDAAAALGLLRAAAGPAAELPPMPDRLPPSAASAGTGAADSVTSLWDAFPDGGGDGGDTGTPTAGGRVTAFVRRRPVRAIALATALAVAAALGTVAAVHALDGTTSHASAGSPPASRAGAQGRAAPSRTGAPSTAPVGAAATLLGDHRTADPCALLDPDVLRAYGDPELDPAYGGFERCDVIVHPTGGGDADVDVEVQFAAGPAPGPLTPVRGSARVRLADERPDGGECDRDLLFPGDPSAHVDVSAQPAGSAGIPSARLCAIAGAAAAKAYAVADAVPEGGHLPRRSPAPPADSLARVDACTLLAPRDLAVVPGVDADHPDIGFGNWACAWHSTTGDMDVRLRYDRGRPPSSGDASVTQVAGRRAYVFPPGDEGDHTGHVAVVHRTFTGTGGDTLDETLDVVVGGSSRTDAQLRALALQFAAEAVGALPAP